MDLIALTIQNEHLRISLSQETKGGLQSLLDRQSGRNFVYAPGPLYELILSRKGDNLVSLTSSDAEAFQAERFSSATYETLTLTCERHQGLDIGVTCRITLEQGSALSRWRISIRNGMSYGIRTIRYPLVAAPAALGNSEQVRSFWLEGGKIDGEHYYAIPTCGTLGGNILFYNAELFDKAGVAYPNENWTWDDFLSAAQALTIREGDETVQWGTAWGYLTAWDGGWWQLVWTRGGQVLDTNFNPKHMYLDSPEVIESWQWLQDLVYKWKVAPPPAVTDMLSQAGGDLQSGKVAMVINGVWMLEPYQNAVPKLGMTLIPKGPAGRGDIAWPTGAGIFKASKNIPLAWTWLRWLCCDEEANKLYAQVGINCGAPFVRAFDKYYSSSWQNTPGGDACVKHLDAARMGGIISAKWGQIWTEVIAPEWDKFTAGKITAEELSAAINDRVNQMLSE